MPKILSVVNQLVSVALKSSLNKRHAAAILSNGRIASIGMNNERTHQKIFRHLHNTSVCCSTHAEMDAIRKARWEKPCILRG